MTLGQTIGRSSAVGSAVQRDALLELRASRAGASSRRAKETNWMHLQKFAKRHSESALGFAERDAADRHVSWKESVELLQAGEASEQVRDLVVFAAHM